MAQIKLTAEILTAALEGFEAQKSRIDTQIAEIKRKLGGGADSGAPEPKRKVSAAARRRMARAQRLRWKKVKQSGA
jgi:hypothetical protein